MKERSGRKANLTWAHEADLVVVGSGAAAFAAASAAAIRGDSVIMLEKASKIGGTTSKAVGMMWVPNNTFMKQKGREDRREDAVAYMCRLSFPQFYNPKRPCNGIPEAEYKLIGAFYDNASRVFDDLIERGALHVVNIDFPDYNATLPENKAPVGRVLAPCPPGKEPMVESGLITVMFKAFIDRHKVPVLTDHKVTELVTNDRGEVIGVMAEHGDKTLAVRAHKAVMFGTGGFVHNQEMRRAFLPPMVYGGCASPGNEGDFLAISKGVGAALGNMNGAWWAEHILDIAVKDSCFATNIWQPKGDSMIFVNRYGKRVVNEKCMYHERGKAHFAWDSTKLEYPNHLLFMIYDDRVANRYESPAVPYDLGKKEYVISAKTADELAAKIDKRLESFEEHIPSIRLDKGFVDTLHATIARFNQFAETGKDLDFNRGGEAVEIAVGGFGWNPSGGVGAPEDLENGKPCPVMFPLSTTGSLHCVILCLSCIDSNGGPKVNEKSQVLNDAGKVIPGLYAAGNCVASMVGQAYWAGGGTLGPYVTFGYVAGENAAKEPRKDV